MKTAAERGHWTRFAWAALLAACGGTEPEPPPPPQATVAQFTYSAAAPCSAVVPEPNDLFTDDSLKSERSTCNLPSDPIEAAIAQVMRDEGVAIDTPIRIPLNEGGSVEPASLSATVAFSLVSGTSSTALPPPIVLLQRTGTASAANGWRVLSFTAASSNGAITVTPAEPLVEGAYYVVVATNVLQSERGTELQAAPITTKLVGAAPIAAGAVEGLDAASAANLERERRRLAPIVALLGRASPNIKPEQIISIQGFSTQLGFGRLLREIDAYKAARARGRFAFDVTTTGGDIAPEDIDPRWTEVMMRFGGCPPQQPISGCYDRVSAFRRGTIRVPKVLDDNGYLRAGWAESTETLEMPFLASRPNMGTEYSATVYLPGFGRSKTDARELSNEYASQLRGTVIGLDLARHGDRTVDPATKMPATQDTMPNNGNTEFAGADGVPDKSGQGFFTADPRALRDGQIASIIEVLHVVEAIKDRDAFFAEGVEVSGREVHLVGQGHSAVVAAAVAAFTVGIRTVVLPGGGIGVKEIVSGGPAPVKEAFLAGAPAGITAANLDAYLDRLEATVLQTISPDEVAKRAGDRLIDMFPQGPRMLLPHGMRDVFVPEAARTRLINAAGLPQSRVSEHFGCDDFFLFACAPWDNIRYVVGGRAQMSTFASSNGMTVLRPAQ